METIASLLTALLAFLVDLMRLITNFLIAALQLLMRFVEAIAGNAR